MAGWAARPLSLKAREAKHQEVKSWAAERSSLKKYMFGIGAGLAGIGLTAMAGSVATVVSVLPLKTVEYRLLSVDQTTGIIGIPVSLKDAPAIFAEATDRFYLKRYVEACFGYVATMTTHNDHLCKLMSSPPEQTRIEDRKGKPDAPITRLKKGGQIDIDSFKASRKQDGADGTREYFVQFVATETEGNAVTKKTYYNGTIDFQWHPELAMKPADRDDNAGGIQVMSNGVTPDAGGKR